MHLSDEGLRLIKSFEGYHKRLQNGDCAAYLCPANVPTIGYGCTEGVKLGMVWTAEKAESEFRRELSKFEDGVNRLVTAEINQNQFDALVSFAYNVGVGGFQGSSVLKRVNSRQFDKVPAALALWNKGGGKVLPGLVSRRQREGALFLKPTEAPEEAYMPQKVTSSWPPWVLWLARLFGFGTGGTVVVKTADVGFSPPAAPDLSWFVGWKGFGETAFALLLWAATNPIKTALVGAVIAVLMFPKLIPEKWRPS
jgi:lysozyme